MSTTNPDPIDVIVGGNFRNLRNRAGMSQEKLGVELGVTFQQVQKYEKGTNRVSASMLARASIALNVNIEAFFFGVPDVQMSAHATDAAELMRLRQENIALAAAIDVAKAALEAASP